MSGRRRHLLSIRGKKVDISVHVRCVLLAGVSVLALPAAAAAQDDGVTENAQLSLDRLIVSAGAEKVAIDTPQAVSSLDQEDIDQLQATTIGDLLEGLPGVSVQGGVSALGQGFNIRGLGTGLADSDSRILMTVDGATKFFEQYRMGAFFSEPELYKRVEVLRGPASSTLYGAGALAGVVNFTTKDASDFLKDGDPVAVRLKAGAETNAEAHLLSGIVALAPVEGLELLGNYSYRRSDHYKDGDGNEVIPSNALSDSWLVKARYSIGGNRKHAIWASYQNWISDSTQIYDQAQALGTTPVRRKVDDKTAVFGYDNDFSGSKLLNIEARISYADSKVHQTETTFLGPLAYSEFSYATWQGKLQNTSQFDLGGDWSGFVFLGVQASKQERRNPRKSAITGVITPGAATHPEGDMTKYGVYGQIELLWSDKLTIIPGVRIDWTKLEPGNGVTNALTVKDSGVSPKIAAIYALTDWLGAFGSVARTVRMPVLDEVFSRTSTAAQNYNFSLKPEKSDNVEAGFTLSFDGIASAHDKLRIKTTAFRNNVKDLITRGTATSPYFVNIGKSRFKGIEVEAEYSAGGFFARGNLAIIDGKNRLTGAYLDTIPANEYRLTLGYADPKSGLSGGWTGEFAEKQDKVSRSALATGGFSVHSLFFAFRPQTGEAEGFEFRVAADNIFDKQFRRHLASRPAEGQTFKFTVAKTF